MKAVSGVVLALLLSACSSGSATPSPTVTTTSASPTPTKSEDPKAVLERVVREYYTEANRALATGNVATLRSLSLDKCACRRLVTYIENKYREGSLRNAQFIVRSIRPYNVQQSRAIVQVIDDSPASQVLDKSGNVIREIPAELGIKEDLYLVLQGGRWVIENIVGLS